MTGTRPIVLAGLGVCLVAMARGVRILRKYKVCLWCRKFNQPSLGDDEYTCRYCGTGLPGDEE